MSIESFLEAIYRALPDIVQSNTYWAFSQFRYYGAMRKYRKQLKEFEFYHINEKKKYILKKIKSMAIYAQEHNRFYSAFYRKNNFDANDLNELTDIKYIPIVNKALLRENYFDWHQPNPNARLSNTGGTSGEPLTFFHEKLSDVKEGVYFEYIWKALGYNRIDRRAVLRGIDIGDNAWIYHKEGDAYCINQYLPLDIISDNLINLFKSQKIKYLHGYPSSIFSLAKYCIDSNSELLNAIRKNLKGIFLGSEYPAEVYRNVIHEAFKVPSVSWYGHSERFILASEMNTMYEYTCLQSYGYCEAEDAGDGDYRLIGTSYDNYSSPFIRYDTGDSVKPVKTEDDLLLTFKIGNGRVGEFIVDSLGHAISLTALIFGRHHEIFNCAEFIQVSQSSPGHAVIHITMPNDRVVENLPNLFDFNNVSVDFEYKIRKTPYKTGMGKVPLLIK